LYSTLTRKAQRETSYRDFIRRLRRELPSTSTGEHISDMRIIVTVIENVFLSNRRALTYAVATFYHPYQSGKSDQYRVIRLYCSREKRGWAVEPFIDEKTSTPTFLPAIYHGPAWRLDNDRTKIIVKIREEIALLRKSISGARDEPPPENLPPAEIRNDEKQESATVPHRQTNRRKIEKLLAVGKVQYHSGRINDAEKTFGEIIAIDPKNTEALEYIGNCRQHRKLEKERLEEIKAIELMLDRSETE
ncbi:MAG: hypothetical protein KAI64_03410, partial [Thermoplasmata archaeon]|nr:hypothetical protein [Thermoplasmata archaeon]